jgi:hypothetical protein
LRHGSLLLLGVASCGGDATPAASGGGSGGAVASGATAGDASNGGVIGVGGATSVACPQRGPAPPVRDDLEAYLNCLVIE